MPTRKKELESICHAIPAEIKLGLTLAVIVIASLIPADSWQISGLLLAVVFAGLSLANVSIGYLGRRLALFLPMLFVFGLTVPVTQFGTTTAWLWTISLWLRCTISFLAGLWLIRVMPIAEMMQLLLRWKCPKVMVAMIGFMYRYVFILWDELARLKNARAARTFGHLNRWSEWTSNAQMVGLLLLRAMERAERSHDAMLARGWDGTPRFLDADR
jgi:cobalt/nickel transport system permease protein